MQYGTATSRSAPTLGSLFGAIGAIACLTLGVPGAWAQSSSDNDAWRIAAAPAVDSLPWQVTMSSPNQLSFRELATCEPAPGAIWVRPHLDDQHLIRGGEEPSRYFLGRVPNAAQNPNVLRFRIYLPGVDLRPYCQERTVSNKLIWFPRWQSKPYILVKFPSGKRAASEAGGHRFEDFQVWLYSGERTVETDLIAHYDGPAPGGRACGSRWVVDPLEPTRFALVLPPPDDCENRPEIALPGQIEIEFFVLRETAYGGTVRLTQEQMGEEGLHLLAGKLQWHEGGTIASQEEHWFSIIRSRNLQVEQVGEPASVRPADIVERTQPGENWCGSECRFSLKMDPSTQLPLLHAAICLPATVPDTAPDLEALGHSLPPVMVIGGGGSCREQATGLVREALGWEDCVKFPRQTATVRSKDGDTPIELDGKGKLELGEPLDSTVMIEHDSGQLYSATVRATDWESDPEFLVLRPLSTLPPAPEGQEPAEGKKEEGIAYVTVTNDIGEPLEGVTFQPLEGLKLTADPTGGDVGYTLRSNAVGEQEVVVNANGCKASGLLSLTFAEPGRTTDSQPVELRCRYDVTLALGWQGAGKITEYTLLTRKGDGANAGVASFDPGSCKSVAEPANTHYFCVRNIDADTTLSLIWSGEGFEPWPMNNRAFTESELRDGTTELILVVQKPLPRYLLVEVLGVDPSLLGSAITFFHDSRPVDPNAPNTVLLRFEATDQGDNTRIVNVGVPANYRLARELETPDHIEYRPTDQRDGHGFKLAVDISRLPTSIPAEPELIVEIKPVTIALAGRSIKPVIKIDGKETTEHLCDVRLLLKEHAPVKLDFVNGHAVWRIPDTVEKEVGLNERIFFDAVSGEGKETGPGSAGKNVLCAPGVPVSLKSELLVGDEPPKLMLKLPPVLFAYVGRTRSMDDQLQVTASVQFWTGIIEAIATVADRSELAPPSELHKVSSDRVEELVPHAPSGDAQRRLRYRSHFKEKAGDLGDLPPSPSTLRPLHDVLSNAAGRVKQYGGLRTAADGGNAALVTYVYEAGSITTGTCDELLREYRSSDLPKLNAKLVVFGSVTSKPPLVDRDTALKTCDFGDDRLGKQISATFFNAGLASKAFMIPDLLQRYREALEAFI